MISLNVVSNIGEVAGWLNGVQRKQLPFATAGALTSTAFDVRKHAVEKTFPRDFNLKNKRFAAATLRVEKASKRKLRAAVYDRLGREYLETQARGGIKKPIDGRNIAIPTQHIKRTKSGKVSAAKRPRAIVDKPNTFIRRGSRGGQILQKGRRKGAPLKTLYQLVPAATIPKRLSFYEDAAKVVQRRLVPNFRQSFDRAMRTARR